MTKRIIITSIAAVSVALASVAQANSNYTEALQKSIYFFNEQALGPINDNVKIPAETGVAYTNPVPWRGDSFLRDGSQAGEPGLVTGFADAGDTIKYNVPQSFAMYILAWSGVAFHQQLDQSGQLAPLSNVLRWGMSYLLNSWDQKDQRLYGQVGIGNGVEHNLWASDEVFQYALDHNNQFAGKYQRRAAYVDLAHPGVDLAAQTAAALASGAAYFSQSSIASDQNFAKQLYQAATQVYAFAQQMRTNPNNAASLIYSNNIGYNATTQGTCQHYANGWCSDAATDAHVTYSDAPGGGQTEQDHYDDKMALASSWLAKAAKIFDQSQYQTYYNDAKSFLSEPGLSINGSAWVMDWADGQYGANMLMASMGDQDALNATLSWLNSLTAMAQNNPDDYLFIMQWESLRYALGGAFPALLMQHYADSGAISLNTQQQQQLTNAVAMAKNQVAYLFGQNPTDYNYIVEVPGAGTNNAGNAHNATAQGGWADNLGQKDDQGNVIYRHQLVGALVGGPQKADGTGYENTVDNFTSNEPTLDGNALLVGTMAAMYNGQAALPPSQFPAKPTADQLASQYYAGAYYLQPPQESASDSNAKVRLELYNHSAWPASLIYNQTARIYLNIPANEIPADKSVQGVKIAATYNGGDYTISPLTGLGNGMYYVDLTTNQPTYPAGLNNDTTNTVPSFREIQFSIDMPWQHDFSHDYSLQNLSQTQPSGNNELPPVADIAVYGKLSDTGTMQLLGGKPYSAYHTPVTVALNGVNSNPHGLTVSFMPVNGGLTQRCHIASGTTRTTCNIANNMINGKPQVFEMNVTAISGYRLAGFVGGAHISFDHGEPAPTEITIKYNAR